MKLCDKHIRERLTDFSKIGLSVAPEKILFLIQEGKIPRELDRALYEGKIVINPLPPLEPKNGESSFLGSSTIDLRLGTKFETLNAPYEVVESDTSQKIIRRCVFDSHKKQSLRLEEYTGIIHQEAGWIVFKINENDIFQLDPNVQVNAFTKEIICLPHDLEGDLGGRSCMARKGISAHISSSRFDAGFCGLVTMEINNAGQCPFLLVPGTRFCALGFHQLSDRVEVPYYQKQYAIFSGQH